MSSILTEAQREMVEQNMGLVYQLAWKYIKQHPVLIRLGLDFDELVSLLSLALCKAVSTYDPARGYKLSALFSKIARNSILMELRKLNSNKRKAQSEAVSLETPICCDGENLRLLDTIISTDLDPEAQFFADIEFADDREILQAAVSGMDAQSRKIMELRYFNGMTQVEISKALGVSQSHVSRRIRAIIRAARKRVEKMRIDGSANGQEENPNENC